MNPREIEDQNAYPQGSHSAGLTKRELFAAMSMQGIRASAHPFAPTNSADIAALLEALIRLV